MSPTLANWAVPSKQTLIRVYDVADDRQALQWTAYCTTSKTCLEPYIADDIRVDEDGNIWAAGGWSPNHAMNGVRVFAPGGAPARRDRAAGSRRESLLRRPPS